MYVAAGGDGAEEARDGEGEMSFSSWRPWTSGLVSGSRRRLEPGDFLPGWRFLG